MDNQEFLTVSEVNKYIKTWMEWRETEYKFDKSIKDEDL